MRAVTITVIYPSGVPQQFTAEPDAERWLYIPRGTKPGEPWFSECEAQFQCSAGCCKYEHRGNYKCSLIEQYWSDTSQQYRLRPSSGRDWSAIAPKPELEPSGQRFDAVILDEVSSLSAESDGEFAVRMLRGCYTRATLYQGGAAWMQRGKVEISLADALRLAAMIGGGK